MQAKEGRAKQARLISDAFREAMKGVCTSIPGHVLTFDPGTQLAQVQVGVLRVDINGAEFTVPPVINVPVCFPGGDFVLEFEVGAGCEGSIFFSQRCIDGWIQSGGVAANPIGRFHSMQDAMFMPGFRSIPGAVSGFANDGVRLRNKAGSQFVWLKGDNTISMQNGAGSFELRADGSFLINGLQITPDGNVITAAGVNLNTHRHSGVTPGTGNSGAPVI
ncbi:Gp138 family membrane-puncturing spike protein [Pseudomonas sp. SWI44]|uniref:Gp138 family membrane-puncturing spike protein n=1 Tax=Pseudomonas sp. SWI44 TaxID=2083053 RepID=UPI000CE5D43C|nr:Gp138 family membrane-puncturing spike protein [Pseudomonas sp. SWI44]AVD86184.1 hypothetical protein C4Q26_03090 [Pseudomonas sp. SWI44]